jgi:hypothetical protein
MHSMPGMESVESFSTKIGLDGAEHDHGGTTLPPTTGPLHLQTHRL